MYMYIHRGSICSPLVHETNQLWKSVLSETRMDDLLKSLIMNLRVIIQGHINNMRYIYLYLSISMCIFIDTYTHVYIHTGTPTKPKGHGSFTRS